MSTTPGTDDSIPVEPEAVHADSPLPDLAGAEQSAAAVAAPIIPTVPGLSPTLQLEPAIERVGTGLLYAFFGVLAGVALTVGVWKLGFVASITLLALAAAATWLYTRGATTPPKKGIVPLIALILFGTVVAFFSCIAIDLSDYYAANAPSDASISRSTFITDNLFAGDVLSSYATDGLMFAAFAGLGLFGTVRRLLAQRHDA